MISPNHHLNVRCPEDFYLRIFKNNFNGKRNEEGHYHIGDGHAFLYVQILGELPENHLFGYQNKTISHYSQRLFEFDVYATPETIDHPILKRSEGILTRRGIVTFQHDWLNETINFVKNLGRILSNQRTIDVTSNLTIEKAIEDALELHENRKEVGQRILNEYGERSHISPYLKEIVNDYKNKEKGNLAQIIPLFQIKK